MTDHERTAMESSVPGDGDPQPEPPVDGGLHRSNRDEGSELREPDTTAEATIADRPGAQPLGPPLEPEPASEPAAGGNAHIEPAAPATAETRFEAPPWPPVTPDPGPATATTPGAGAISGGRRGPGWLAMAAIALVAALIGGGVVAAVDRADENDAAGPRVGVTRDGGNSSVLTSRSDIQSVLSAVEPGVVSIQTEQFQRGVFGELRRAQGAGTGMILTADGEVLTNAHVVAGAQRIEVTLGGEKEARAADLVGSDPTADVAVIKIRDATDLPTVKLGSSRQLAVGDDVIAIGNALALAGGLSVTQGIVSALNRSLEDADIQLDDLIQTDAAINNGNSGGPLVNAAGEVVGINTVVIQQSAGGNLVQNVGFAIAIDAVKPLLEDLRAGGGRVRSTAFLGISSQTLTAEDAEQLGVDRENGALVVTVAPGSPAENAGLERFDVIVRFGDEAVESAEDVTAAVADHKPGDKVEVEYVRGDRERKTTVTLGSRQVGRQ